MRNAMPSRRSCVLAEIGPWIFMAVTFAILMPFRDSVAVDIAGMAWGVAILLAGMGWMMAGHGYVGGALIGTRIAAVFFGGFVTFMFHNSTSDSPWLDVVFAVAIAPPAVHIILVPPISAFLLSRRIGRQSTVGASAAAGGEG